MLTLNVLRSEWVKARSLVMTYGLLAVMLAGMILTCQIMSRDAIRHMDEAQIGDPVGISLSGVMWAQYVAGTLGIVIMSSEYVSGSIVPSLVAVPRRLMLLGAKAQIAALVIFPPALAGCLVSFLYGQSIIAASGMEASLATPGVWRAILGAAAYLAVTGMIGIALGTIFRNTAGALVALFALLFVGLIFPANPFLPSNAGQAVIWLIPPMGGLSPALGFALYLAYASALLALAGWVFVKRDH